MEIRFSIGLKSVHHLFWLLIWGYILLYIYIYLGVYWESEAKLNWAHWEPRDMLRFESQGRQRQVNLPRIIVNGNA